MEREKSVKIVYEEGLKSQITKARKALDGKPKGLPLDDRSSKNGPRVTKREELRQAGFRRSARAEGFGSVQEWHDSHKREQELIQAQEQMMDMTLGCCSSKCKCHSIFVQIFRQLSLHWAFNGFIIGVIFLAAGLVGLSTYEIADVELRKWLLAIDEIVMGLFISEIAIKILAEGKRPWLYIFTGEMHLAPTNWAKMFQLWNIFDFSVVFIGLMPFGGSAVTALRLIRLLRVLKLVRALPKLRILVTAMVQSLSSIVYIGLLLILLFYLYAVLGVVVFRPNDPVHFSSMHIAMLSLFRSATTEDWTDIMYISYYGCDKYGYSGGLEEQCTTPESNPLLSVFYNCSFIVLASMMILNLFIGVITSSMEEAKDDLGDEDEAADAGQKDDVMAIGKEELLRNRIAEIMDRTSAVGLSAIGLLNEHERVTEEGEAAVKGVYIFDTYKASDDDRFNEDADAGKKSGGSEAGATTTLTVIVQ